MDFQRPALTLSARNKDISLSVKCDGHVQQGAFHPDRSTAAHFSIHCNETSTRAQRRPRTRERTSYNERMQAADRGRTSVMNRGTSSPSADPRAAPHCLLCISSSYLTFLIVSSGCIGLLDLCDVCLLLCVGLT